MSSFFAVGWMLAVASAADRPLAIPVEDQPSTPPTAAEAAPAPEISPEQSQAVRQYRDQHLKIRTWTQVSSTSSGYYTGMGYGNPGFWGGWYVAAPTVISEEHWGIYQGPQRMDNLDYLRIIGAQSELENIQRQITTKRRTATALNAAALTGGVAVLVGMIGVDNAQTVPTARGYQIVATTGLVTLFGGAVAGAFPGKKARKLQYEPTMIRPLEALQDEIADHNALLAEQLGISPADALQVENTTR